MNGKSSILWRVLYLFPQENLQSCIVWKILSAVGNIVISKHTHSHLFNGTLHFSDVKTYSDPICPTHFVSVYFRTPVTVKQTYWNSYILRAVSIINKREQPLQAATFSQKDFFRIRCFLEQLFLSNIYLLVTNTFSKQLLFEEYSYCFGGTAVSPE